MTLGAFWHPTIAALMIVTYLLDTHGHTSE
jgi:hypothetical protein